MNGNLFHQTSRLIGLLFRQARMKIIVWLAILVGLTLSVAIAYPSVYQTEEDKIGFALTMENPAMIAMLGPSFDLEKLTIGAIFAHEMFLFTTIAAAVMNILLVASSTRGDEEDGRLELIQALPVGRLAYLHASFIVIVIVNLLLSLLTGIGLYFIGAEGIDGEGAFLYGILLGAVGLFFAGITYIFSQLFETARQVTLWSIFLLIGAYIVRAIGDVSEEGLSLISPLGWALKAQVFIENYWWPVFLLLGIALLFVFISYYLHQFRDLNAGFIQPKKGKDEASSLLKTSIGFAFYLERVNIFAWGIGLFLLSAAFGAILGDLETYYGDMEIMEAFLTRTDYSLTDQFISLLIAIMTLIGTIPTIMAMSKIRREEMKNRTENFYSKAVSRSKVMGSFFLVGLGTSVIMQLFISLGLWSVGVQGMEQLELGTILKAAFVFLPAIWILLALTMFLIGVFPKITSFIWIYYAFCFAVLYLGELLSFPEWVNNLSPFHHVPLIPMDEINISTMILAVVLSMIIGVAGLIGYNRRDLQG